MGTYPFKLRVLSGYMPRSGIARSYRVLRTSFTVLLFSIVAVPIDISTNSVEGLVPFL